MQRYADLKSLLVSHQESAASPHTNKNPVKQKSNPIHERDNPNKQPRRQQQDKNSTKGLCEKPTHLPKSTKKKEKKARLEYISKYIIFNLEWGTTILKILSS